MSVNQMRRCTDGTEAWPEKLTPVDKVELAMAAYMRARIHADIARNELDEAVRRLVMAARGGHT